jgi:hypothetical protein
MFKEQVLFGLPTYKTDIDPKSYDKEKIVEEIIHNYELDSERNVWDKDYSTLHHSLFDYENEKFLTIDYESLIPIYHEKIKEFFDKSFINRNPFDWEFNVVSYTATKDSQYMARHAHLPEVLSCIHYIKFDKDEHTSTTFHNPDNSSHLFYSAMPQLLHAADQTALSNSYLLPDVTLPMEEDDFMIFPANALHSIGPQKSDKLRIAIVININIIPLTEVPINPYQ